MNRLFGKIQNGTSRLFRKAEDGSSRLLGKFQTQVLDNPRLLHTVAKGLNYVADYGGRIGTVGSGLATGLGQPEIGAVLGASTALAGASGHASHLLNDRANYLERRQAKESGPTMQFH